MKRLSELVAPVTPSERLALVRVLVGLYAFVYLLVRSRFLLSYAVANPDMWRPIGVTWLMPDPLLPWVVRSIVIATIALSIPFLLGFKHRWLAKLFAAGLLFVLTYSNSWGQILHTDNAFVLFVIVLAMSRSADALSLDQRGSDPAPASRRYGWPLRLMATACVLVYLIAGVAKLQNSGLGFIEGETLRNYVAFGAVRKIQLGSMHSPIGSAMLGMPWLFQALAVFSLVLELGAPAALLSRRVGVAWAVLIWGFHIGVLAVMAIGFVFQLSGAAFLPFFRVERLLEWGPIKRKLNRGSELEHAHEGSA